METIKVEFNTNQVQILRSLFSNVIVNNQTVPLVSIVNVLNAVSGTDPQQLGMNEEMVKSYGAIFNNVGTLPINLPITEVIGMLNAVNAAAGETDEKMETAEEVAKAAAVANESSESADGESAN